MTELPEHLIIIGGSYIGLEFGQMFKRFGSKVTILEESNQIIHKEDKDISDSIKKSLEKDGVHFIMDAKNSAATGKTGSIKVTYEVEKNSHFIYGTHLLLAVGRIPNSDNLNLEATLIKKDDHNYIVVDDFCQTNIQGIFAVGDCNGQGAFTHTAYNDYEIVSSYLFYGKRKKNIQSYHDLRIVCRSSVGSCRIITQRSKKTKQGSA